MTLTGIDLTRYKEKLLAMLQAFDEFCTAHSLQYFAAYGTAIGAVRHHDIIPWDDDIDLYMPRKDYKRLMSIRQELPPPVCLVTPADEGYYKHFCKLTDSSTSVWEVESIPYMIGVYIDIFPLDFAPDNLKEAKRLKLRFNQSCWNLRRSLHRATWRDILLESFAPFRYKILARNLYGKCWLSWHQEQARKRFERYGTVSLSYEGTSHITCYYDPYKERSVLESAWFDDYVYMPFGSCRIRMPKGYDPYLRKIYGDYMQLPPVEQRASLHTHYFFDLERRLTIDEARRQLADKPP